ncbi:uncharacterized protein [Manis javanica]|uniref:uncharacterized protein n=1 Tax=Manis javanica TaxID=9974 RepID=UPI003C6D4FE2
MKLHKSKGNAKETQRQQLREVAGRAVFNKGKRGIPGTQTLERGAPGRRTSGLRARSTGSRLPLAPPTGRALLRRHLAKRLREAPSPAASERNTRFHIELLQTVLLPWGLSLVHKSDLLKPWPSEPTACRYCQAATEEQPGCQPLGAGMKICSQELLRTLYHKGAHRFAWSACWSPCQIGWVPSSLKCLVKHSPEKALLVLRAVSSSLAYPDNCCCPSASKRQL